MTICARCDKKVSEFSYSFFTDDACCHPCLAIEKAHPLHKKAKEAELKALQNGDRNFKGIGLPEGLFNNV